mgnify:CR=1 FL=1
MTYFLTKLRFILLALFLLLIFLASAWYYYQGELKAPLNLSTSNVLIEIKQGDSLNTVLAHLRGRKVLKTPWIAKLYAKEKQLANKLKVGEFSLRAGANMVELFDLITSNQQVSYSIRFIEGTTFRDMQKVLASQSKLKHLLGGLSEAEILKRLNLDSRLSKLEGQFYPDTYTFLKNDTDISILQRAHKRLKTILESEWANKQKGLPLKTPYEALILASIVEKETGAAHERSEIAGVFLRRLNQRMRLQTDPTVIYGLGERYQGNITRKHLKEVTPYNTYRIKGLPPTPIAMVGRDAIHAAVNPKKGTSLYFVAKGDGTHQFSDTIKAHNSAVRKFQLKRRTDYRSSQ